MSLLGTATNKCYGNKPHRNHIDNRIIHHKRISKPVKTSEPRETDGRFAWKENKDPTTPERSLLQDDPSDTIPE